MGRGLALSVVACAALSGVAIVSPLRGAGLGLLAAGGAAGLVVGLWLAGPGRRRPKVHPLELMAVAGVLAFLLPLLTMAVAPGADMAMHAALARALLEASDALSAAWGSVNVALYPRGLAALIALAAPALGIAKASLLASGLAHVVVLLGLAAFLTTVVRSRWPFALATVAVLASKSPQSFFDWGGNPTAMAFGLALFAVAQLGASWSGSGGSLAVRSAAGASFFLLGAAATHPAGALAGALSVAGLPMLGRPTRKGMAAAAVALLAFGAGLLALSVGGPQVSAAEAAWIADYQRNVEAVLRGPAALFPVEVWRGMAQRLGVAWTVTVAAAALVVAAARLWRPIAGMALAVVAVGAVLAIGPLLPGVGLLFYPARFAPLLLVATVPLVGSAFERLDGRLPVLARGAFLVLAVTAAVMSVRTYQRAIPMATANDLAAIECVRTRVPPSDVVEGAYGDASQWIPALAGIAVTAAHPHITLNDEIRTQPARRSTYRFVGERLRYGTPLDRPSPTGPPLCAFGKAALFRLTD
ncbi:MAG: hypothetical protein QM765_21335 [Myxococcales bacterium]